MSGLGLEYLNHASMLLDFGNVRLLCDPWFEGTAFSDGWGLCYHDPAAYERADRATHLWISHWHSDHLHAPTLKRIAERRPGLIVLANESANFSMAGRLRKLGFADVRPLAERTPVDLDGEVTVTRYPTAGIDNMLHLRSGRWSVLNYNDCNLPGAAVRRLVRRMGGVDLMLANYNHAGKLFDRDPTSARKRQFLGGMLRAVDAASPRWVVPFASSHRYRAPWSVEQNESLWTFDELAAETAGDPRYAVMRVGDRARVDDGGVRVTPRQPVLRPMDADVADYGEPVPWDELLGACSARAAEMDRQFLGAARLLPTLAIRVEDHDRVISLRPGAPARVDAGLRPHVTTHSRALYRWLGQPFGDDTFFAGAHFGIVGDDTRAIRSWALATLLDGSHLTPRHALGFLRRSDGRWFLWNRREEAVATVLGARFRAGQLRG